MLVKFFATYRAITKCETMNMEAPADILALLEELSDRWPDFRDKLLSSDGTELGPDAIVMVNGRHIVHLEGVRTPLADDDTVAVLPLVAGG